MASVYPWVPVGSANLTLQQGNALSKALPFSINIAPLAGATGQIGFANPGYWGIDVQPQTYQGTFYVRGIYNGPITASLVSAATNESLAAMNVSVLSTSSKWTQYNYTLAPTVAGPTVNNSLTLSFDPTKATDGSLNFNFISLFPPTFKNRVNGMRPELMTYLGNIKPAFLRMPGGVSASRTPWGT